MGGRKSWGWEKMSNVLAEFYWPVRVYMEDTDAGGIVYYVNYLKFMERARTEALRSLGFDKNWIFAQESMFVVHSMQVDYKQPARLDDNLRVEAHIMKLRRTSIIFRQNIELDGNLLCEAAITIACVSKDSMKPVAIPDTIYQSLKNLTSQ